jgi:hypothetical protein
MKNVYVTPGVERLRVFLEKSIADTATVSVVGVIGEGEIKKEDWVNGTAPAASDGDVLLPF